ncbi:hypothetical protein RVS70_05755 [Virgibacillus sp. M23]|uniref:hypothetical protein n=1 Tax=Virgibacillus sp. M23 TaxID=3079030 RepID=UPI002A91B4AA|nr:hypothetical protein [Virgibacillus sp. M23]MDY7043706.1 hypothetical protein [Virgibacillus sp. M23]
MKKRIMVFLISISLIGGVLFLLLPSNKNNDAINTLDIEESEQFLSEQGNTVAYGIKDTHGNIIDTGTEIPLENNSASIIFSLDHNIDEEREYMLLVFQDYKLSDYFVENSKEKTNNYKFNMNPNSTKEFNLSIDIDKSSQELSLVVIRKPAYQLEEMDFNRANILGETLSGRYTVNDKTNISKHREIIETKPDLILEDGTYDDLAIYNNIERMKVAMTGTVGEELSLSVGNSWGEDITYAIIALTDWKQDVIIGDKEVIFTTVKNESRNVFNFQLPNKEANFQFISFPFAYQVSENNYQSHYVFDTFRVLIQED